MTVAVRTCTPASALKGDIRSLPSSEKPALLPARLVERVRLYSNSVRGFSRLNFTQHFGDEFLRARSFAGAMSLVGTKPVLSRDLGRCGNGLQRAQRDHIGVVLNPLEFGGFRVGTIGP